MVSFSKPVQIDDFADELSFADNFDLALVCAIINLAQTELTQVRNLNAALLEIVRKEEKNRTNHYKNGRKGQSIPKKRADQVPHKDEGSSKFPSWDEIRDSVSDRIFRRKYRMTKEQFDLLCCKILEKIGPERFRLNNTTQGLCGYTRVAIGLRLLFGGSYLDLVGRAYEVNEPKTIYRYFHTLVDWVDEVFDFPWVTELQKLNKGDLSALEKLKEISTDFAIDSNDSFEGCIGAIDGLAIRITCPSNVKDPSNYFCRKNFYALNVQAICDHQERIFWISL